MAEPRVCGDCGQTIEGQILIALEKSWHPDHFKCTTCKEAIGTGSFMIRDGQPYCENDYHQQFSPRCAKCEEPIKGRYVSALEKTWHPEHFVCAHCEGSLGEDGFHTHDDKAYCRTHYYELFAPKCDSCQKPLMQSYLSALGKRWHPDCFLCSVCGKPVQGTTFNTRGDQPVCRECFLKPPPTTSAESDV